MLGLREASRKRNLACRYLPRLTVQPSCRTMTGAAEWEGGVGRNWAAEWRRTDRSFAGLTRVLLARISKLPGRAIVDIGCGAGELSLAIAKARPRARVLGIDISPDLVAAAAVRGSRTINCAFALADATCWEADRGAPELYVSRHGVMFFPDPVAAFAHLAAVAASEARLAFSCFRSPAQNPWAGALAALIDGPAAPPDPTAPGPFAFADPERVAGILAAAGWQEAAFEPVDYRYLAGAGADPLGDAREFFLRIGPAAAAFRALPEEDRAPAMMRIEAFLAEHVANDEVAFPAAAWIVTARRDEQ